MRIFLSYKFTGLSTEEITNTTLVLLNKLRSLGHTVFCNYEKLEEYSGWSTTQIMEDCFKELDKYSSEDLQISFIHSGISEGLLVELGYAKKLGMKTLMIKNENLSCHSSAAVCDDVIKYNNFEEMLDQLELYLEK